MHPELDDLWINSYTGAASRSVVVFEAGVGARVIRCQIQCIFIDPVTVRFENWHRLQLFYAHLAYSSFLSLQDLV